MQLDEARHKQLVELVSFMIGEPVQQPVVKELIGLEAMSRAPAGLNGPRYAEWLVNHTLALESPEVFIRVVRQVDLGGAAPELHALVAELEAQPSRWSTASVLGALWAPPEWPFVDRESLRQTLNAMADGEGPNALTIEGSLGQGKRTVSSYVRQLAAKTQSFRPVVAELRREPGQGLLRRVVEDLRLQLELDFEVRTTHAEPERQAQILASDLGMEALEAPVPVWFLANVIDPAGIEEGILPFIDELLRLVGLVPTLGKKLRLIVLSESVSILSLKNLPAVEHRHVLPDVDKEAVTAWLTASVPGRDEALYALAVKRIFRRIEETPPAPPDRLRTLAMGCIAAHRWLLKAPAV